MSLCTFAFHRIPFGLCNTPRTFQRCMMAIFLDFLERSFEIFMDDFSVFGNSFKEYLGSLEEVLEKCKETQLVLSWNFMVTDKIMLERKILNGGLEVDPTKFVVIGKYSQLSMRWCLRTSIIQKVKVYNLINLYNASWKRNSSLFYHVFNVFIAGYK